MWPTNSLACVQPLPLASLLSSQHASRQCRRVFKTSAEVVLRKLPGSGQSVRSLGSTLGKGGATTPGWVGTAPIAAVTAVPEMSRPVNAPTISSSGWALDFSSILRFASCALSSDASRNLAFHDFRDCSSDAQTSSTHTHAASGDTWAKLHFAGPLTRFWPAFAPSEIEAGNKSCVQLLTPGRPCNDHACVSNDGEQFEHYCPRQPFAQECSPDPLGKVCH